MKEVLLALLSTSLQTVGEAKLLGVLQDLADNDKVQYEAAVRAGHSFVLAVKPLVDKTKTPIDDAILDALGDAIQSSASQNGITL